MYRASSLIRCTLLALAVTACGAKRVASHTAARHARTAVPAASSALWVADQYYVASSFPDEAAHATGEFAQRFAAQPSLGALLAPTASVALRSVRERGDSAVVAATVTEPDRKRVAEWYTYLVRDAGVWKIYSVRTVRFDGAYYALLDSLTRGTRAPEVPGQDASMRLATASDSAVHAFVATHASQLDSLVAAYRATPNVPTIVSVRDSVAPVRRLLTASSASAVFRNASNPACTFVRINGDTRRQVGAFRADSGCRIPSMSPAGIIYTEHVQGDWYLYRAL